MTFARVRRAHCYVVPGVSIAIVAIPKVAANSIYAAVLQAGGIPLQNGSPHVTIGQFRTWPEVAREQGFFVAAIVRNPWDRLVSGWADKSVNITPTLATIGFRPGMSFAEWLRHAQTVFMMDHHLCPQAHLLMHSRAFVADFIGRFERIDDDWERLRAIAPELPALQHTNASEHNQYRDHYSDRILDLAAPIVDRDATLFGYRFAAGK